jgi:putative phosphoesterase
MRIGLLSDAHGNPYGLEKCLQILHSLEVEQVLCLGDSVGYLPDSYEVLERLHSANAICLTGNHEAMLLGQVRLDKDRDEVYRIGQSRHKISQQQINRMSTWMPFRYDTIGGRRLLFVHGSPWDPANGYVYPDSDLRLFSRLSFDAVFMGHTHIPFISQTENVQVVNVGSCGLPRDHGNLLSCATYDTDKASCKIIRVEFDPTEIIRKYRNNTNKAVIECLMRE